MQDTELKQLADFLSIAVESIEEMNDDVAVDFLDDVADDLDGKRARSLRSAIDDLAAGRRAKAIERVEEVSSALIQQIDDL